MLFCFDNYLNDVVHFLPLTLTFPFFFYKLHNKVQIRDEQELFDCKFIKLSLKCKDKPS